jgi:D-alanyl-D-alanine carboxypeptidase
MLTHNQFCLINGDELDAVPACLYTAKANQHARNLAQSDWLVRDKHSGNYLATVKNQTIRFLQRKADDTKRIAIVNELFSASMHTNQSRPNNDVLAMAESLNIDVELYALKHQLELVAEPCVLEYAGKDRYQRALWLEYNTKQAWLRMRLKAKSDDVMLEAISGFRGHHYQMGIFQRKIARGLTINEILNVNTAPGFSEHHSGRAIDISTVGEPAAEQSFEQTAAFNWLNKYAGNFGFRLSYPRRNIHGISYEPWHWYYLGND